MARWKLKKLGKKLPPTEKGESPIRWDKTSIIGLIFICATILVFYFDLIPDFRAVYYKNSSKWTSAIGKIQEVTPIEGVSQNKDGNHLIITGYKFIYIYNVGGVPYDKVATWNLSGKTFARYIQGAAISPDVEVFYKKDDPSQSYLNTDINSRFYKSRD